MPRLTPDEFLAVLKKKKASAILRTSDHDAARQAMEAAIAGGFRVIEFTLSIPGAMDLVEEFSRREDLYVGVGTVLTVAEVCEAVQRGATFLVSPVMDREIVIEAVNLEVVMMPGCSTPTEMLMAHRDGAQLQKLFPAPGTGPAWVAQTLGPLPFLKIVPTSGVTLENAAAYLKAGAFAVGFVNSLFDPADIAAGRFDEIRQRAEKMLAAVRNS